MRPDGSGAGNAFADRADGLALASQAPPGGAWLPTAPADAVDERVRGSAVGAIGRKP